MKEKWKKNNNKIAPRKSKPTTKQPANQTTLKPEYFGEYSVGETIQYDEYFPADEWTIRTDNDLFGSSCP